MVSLCTKVCGWASLCTQAQFDHMGTTEEYLYHMCSNEVLSRACGFSTETMVRHVGPRREDGQGKVRG